MFSTVLGQIAQNSCRSCSLQNHPAFGLSCSEDGYILIGQRCHQCKDGRVEGILTKQEDIIYFPLFAHAVQVSATGYCEVGTPPAPVQEPAAPESPSEETASEAAARELRENQ